MYVPYLQQGRPPLFEMLQRIEVHPKLAELFARHRPPA